MSDDTRAGIAVFAGAPNAGKSTLLNRLVGQKLAITSPKPQSTRDRVVGILTRGGVQLVLFDTPGLLNPTYALQRAMRATALAALRDADVVAYICDATAGVAPALGTAAALTPEEQPTAPILTVYNKCDALSAEHVAVLRDASPNALFISALTGDGVEALEQRLAQAMPVSPYLYPEEDASTQTLRFFVSELLRETALEQLEDEVPYAIAAQVEEFREDRQPVYIRAVLYVERESQKRILIGKSGTRIREIGRVARAKIESLVGTSVYLDLWVKVLANWRRDASALRRLGYVAPEEQRK